MRISDWSSDVCSSDLKRCDPRECGPSEGMVLQSLSSAPSSRDRGGGSYRPAARPDGAPCGLLENRYRSARHVRGCCPICSSCRRSEVRRVGKACVITFVSLWLPILLKNITYYVILFL